MLRLLIHGWLTAEVGNEGKESILGRRHGSRQIKDRDASSRLAYGL